MLNDVRYVPGVADARIQQPFNYPNMTVNVDRTRAQTIGLTQRDVAQSVLVALSGSFQTSPSFYLDPRNGVSYNIAVQTPQYGLDSLAELRSLPVTARSVSCQFIHGKRSFRNCRSRVRATPYPSARQSRLHYSRH
jgi:multidrug efflux pump subunit AcrB